MLIHVIRGDSVDPIGDFVAINQELELFNPILANKTQVVVLNKIDLPEVRDQQVELLKQLRKVAGHTRVIPISAATGENVRDLMVRTKKLVDALPAQTSAELFTDEEERVNFEEEENNNFEILSDPKFPGQFRIVGEKIEKMVLMANWKYYESVLRFQRVLDAQGITEALENAGAKQGDLIMIGDMDFNYWDRKNQWMADLGLEDVNPRKRYDNKD